MNPLPAILLALLGMPLQCDLPDREPVIGGPCEGCEFVFEGLPVELESRARIAPADEAGAPLVIHGIVTTSAGDPAPGIVVYAYHTDDSGVYPSAETWHGRLRGWTRTDASGRYWFDTIRPGAYPERDSPEHVHMHVLEPGKGTYYIDDVIFDDDPLLTAAHRERMRRGRGGDGLAYPVKDEQGVWQVRRDIVLGENIPGYE